MVYHQPQFTSAEQFKRAVLKDGENCRRASIDRAINDWRHQLECVIQPQGRPLNTVSD